MGFQAIHVKIFRVYTISPIASESDRPDRRLLDERVSTVGILKPERPGGSGFVIASWKVPVAGGARLAEWLSRVREFANWHDHRWNEVDEWEAQHAFLDERFGRASAMELGLRRLHLHFLVEADRAAEWFES